MIDHAGLHELRDTTQDLDVDLGEDAFLVADIREAECAPELRRLFQIDARALGDLYACQAFCPRDERAVDEQRDQFARPAKLRVLDLRVR